MDYLKKIGCVIFVEKEESLCLILEVVDWEFFWCELYCGNSRFRRNRMGVVYVVLNF
jgi:hypothetical protein